MTQDDTESTRPARDAASHWKHRKFTSLSSYGFSKGRLGLWLDTTFQTQFRQAMLARLARLTRHRQPFARVVDLACGIGDWTLRYLPFAREVVGVDVNPEFLAGGLHLADSTLSPPDRARVTFVESDVGDFDDYRGADLVCFGGCAMYCSDELLERLFAAIVRTMPTNGMVYMRTSVRADGLARREIHNDNGTNIIRPQADYLALAERHGLRVLDASFSPTVLGEARFGRALGGFIGARMHRWYDDNRKHDYCNYLFVRS
jgi:SAM-dependent methyltransferase